MGAVGFRRGTVDFTSDSAMSMRFCVGLLVLCLLSVPVFAQPGPPQDDGPRQGPRRGPERMLNHLKSALDVNDQEWTTLRPKIEEVMALRRDLAPMGGPPGMMMGGGFGPGDGPPPMRGNGPRDNNNEGPYGNPPATQPSQGNRNTAADQLPAGRQDEHQPPRSEVRDRFDDLQDALDNKNTKSEELEQKIAAYRAARKEAMEKLKKSQDELRQSLTPMQQAVLITAGLMD
jgi:hypothetical protein